ncbi:MAG: cell division protein FtsA [Elusimicrobiota bacterium]|jgi:cell division protein FtsA|nr:cell division protein FtsA [Elusimicrobiota bacterium]
MIREKRTSKYLTDEDACLYAGIDIGGGQVTCVVGAVDFDARTINIMGGAQTQTEGVLGGAIVDLTPATGAIKSVLKRAEGMAGNRAESAVVAIRGTYIEAAEGSGSAATDMHTKLVTQEVIENAKNNAQDIAMGKLTNDSEIFQMIVKDLILDGKYRGGIGMKASNVEVDIYGFAAPIFRIEDIENVLAQAEIDCAAIKYAYLAVSDVVIRSEEYDECLLIDYGASNIGIVVYSDKRLRFTQEIETGSEMMTVGISRYLKTSRDEARKIKEKYGAAIIGDNFENEKFEYLAADGVTMKESDRISICQDVISVEIDKTLSAIESILLDHGFNVASMSGGIILTGGGSRLQYLKDAFERFFEGVPVRVATPNPMKVSGNKDIINNLSYTGAIGALYGMASVQASQQGVPSSPHKKPPTTGGGKISHWWEVITKFLKDTL